MEDTKTPATESVTKYITEDGEVVNVGGLLGVDEDLRPQPDTNRKELWSYYLYYNGDNGVGPGSYSMAL